MPSRWAIRALREIAAVLVYVGWLVFWLVSKIVALFLGLALWMLLAYTRLRYGRPVADELLRAARESEAEGRALRERTAARIARRLGWTSEGEAGHPPLRG